MVRRVSFCGASGTGKTTLAMWLVDKYGIPFNPIGSRSVAAAMGYKSPYEVDLVPGARAIFQRKLVADKIAWEAAHESFVTDRATLDNITYTALHDVRAVDAEILDLAAKAVMRYTHVFFCPMGSFFDTGDDPVRVKERTYHELFEMLLEGLVKKHTASWRQTIWTVRSRSLEDRKAEILNVLEPPQ